MAKTPKITLTVSLPGPVTGQAVMDAVKRVAKGGYHEEVAETTDDVKLYEIGHNTEDWSKDCVVLADGGNIYPSKAYSKVEVRFCEHEGEKWLHGVTNEAIEKNMRKFRDQLSAALKK